MEGESRKSEFCPISQPDTPDTGPVQNIPRCQNPSGTAGRNQSCPYHSGMAESELKPGNICGAQSSDTSRDESPAQLSTLGCSQERAAEHLGCGAALCSRCASSRFRQNQTNLSRSQPDRGISMSKSSRCPLRQVLGLSHSDGWRGNGSKNPSGK